jgi:hypothetical protein
MLQREEGLANRKIHMARKGRSFALLISATQAALAQPSGSPEPTPSFPVG